MGKGKLTEHAQNLKGCEKCNLRKAVEIFNTLWVGITVIVQEGLKLTYYCVIEVIAQEVLSFSYSFKPDEVYSSR